MFTFTGVIENTPEGKKRARAAILLCSADLPAKALVANSYQYNGHFGCNTCNSFGTAVGRKLCWPHEDTATVRTHDTIVSCFQQAIALRKPVSFIKCPNV